MQLQALSLNVTLGLSIDRSSTRCQWNSWRQLFSRYVWRKEAAETCHSTLATVALDCVPMHALVKNYGI